jgi:hypothetical protein
VHFINKFVQFIHRNVTKTAVPESEQKVGVLKKNSKIQEFPAEKAGLHFRRRWRGFCRFAKIATLDSLRSGPDK